MKINTQDIKILRSRYLNINYGIKNISRLSACNLAIFALILSEPLFSSKLLFLFLCIFAFFLHQKELSEWLHEASHFNFYPNPKINDLIINLSVGTIFGLSLSQYRSLHFKHHATKFFLNDVDPDTRSIIAISKKYLILGLLSDLLGIRALKSYFEILKSPQDGKRTLPIKSKISTHWFLALGFFQITLITCLYLSSKLYLYFLYYFVLITLYQAFSRIRSYGQHSFIDNNQVRFYDSNCSRTIDAGFFDRLFFTSRIMMYHHEHHLYPSIPYRGLINISRDSSDVNKFSTSRISTLI